MGYMWLGLLAFSALGLLWLMKLHGPILTLAAASLASRALRRSARRPCR